MVQLRHYWQCQYPIFPWQHCSAQSKWSWCFQTVPWMLLLWAHARRKNPFDVNHNKGVDGCFLCKHNFITLIAMVILSWLAVTCCSESHCRVPKTVTSSAFPSLPCIYRVKTFHIQWDQCYDMAMTGNLHVVRPSWSIYTRQPAPCLSCTKTEQYCVQFIAPAVSTYVLSCSPGRPLRVHVVWRRPSDVCCCLCDYVIRSSMGSWQTKAVNQTA